MQAHDIQCTSENATDIVAKLLRLTFVQAMEPNYQQNTSYLEFQCCFDLEIPYFLVSVIHT